MTKRKYRKQEISPDARYNSIQVAKLINQIMKKGQKETARKIVYQALEDIKKKTPKDPLEVLNQALGNVSPLVEVKPKRVGGATYQVPVPVKGERKETLAIRWILKAARNKKGRGMKEKLVGEIIDAAENRGAAVKKKEDTHKMAEANRAFAHFRW
jgi:small subunit ribosomal protein S7